MDIRELFMLGMDRHVGNLLDPLAGPQFDCGSSGSKKIEGAKSLGLPKWNYPRDPIPAEDGSVAMIHAYHFMEHLPGETAIQFLAEAQRVLMVGGILQFCMPYYNSNLMSQDLTHKSFWSEDSFRNLFRNDYYDASAGKIFWKFHVQSIFIMGIVERNLSLLGQLVKVK